MEKIAIAGFAEEGRATLRYLRRIYSEERDGSRPEITVCDRNPELELPAGVEAQVGEDYLAGMDRFDRIFRTPGLNPGSIMNANPGMDERTITTMTNEFFRVAPTPNIIGVTGTKGKGTTTTLIARILEQAGQRVHIGGNIGTPALDLFPDIKESDWVVLELSSFQLLDIHDSPRIAVCLKITPDHMDWHADMEEYVAAKSRICAYQKDSDVAVYYADNQYASRIAGESAGRKIAYSTQQPADIRVEQGAVHAGGQRVIEVDRIGLRGPHNRENVCAATGAAVAALRYAAGSGGCPDIHLPQPVMEHIRTAIQDFDGLEHRLEFVAREGGVSFYNDSFSTNPEPTMAAIRSFSEPQILILGGSGKGADFTELARKVADAHVKHAVLIGEEADRIQAALASAGFTAVSRGGDSMQDIVEEASRHAGDGDVVILSPGCASFGMFNDYKDRGNQFKAAVARAAAP